MSVPVIIMNEIEPTQHIGAMRLDDGTDNILVVVGDGDQSGTVHI